VVDCNEHARAGSGGVAPPRGILRRHARRRGRVSAMPATTNLRQGEAPSDQWQECIDIVDALPQQELPQRAAVIEQLLRNPSGAIRMQALHLGSVAMSDAQLVGY